MTKASHPIDPDLENILKDNPFRDPMLMASWEKELSRLREGERGPCDLDYEFVLEDDREFLNTPHGRKKELFGKSICTNVLPQPMTGHPQAPIWILLLNPGFCAKDYYDHINVSEKMRRCIVKTGGGEYTDQSFDKPGPEAKRKLEKRQNLILSDLRAENWPSPFYILDESFETSPEDIADGWHWWRKRLRIGKRENSFFPPEFCKNGEEANAVGRCLFVLEAFPYHSGNFPQNIVKPWRERQTKYFQFWKRLVQYGLTHKKTIVIRASDVGRGALGELLAKADIDLEKQDALFFKNTQQVYFTPANFLDRTPIDKAIEKTLQQRLQ